MPMRPLVGRGYAPDTRAVSEAVAPMVNACDPRTKVRTKSRRGRSPDLRDPSPPFAMPMRQSDAGVLPVSPNDLLAPHENDPPGDGHVRPKRHQRGPLTHPHPHDQQITRQHSSHTCTNTM